MSDILATVHAILNSLSLINMSYQKAYTFFYVGRADTQYEVRKLQYAYYKHCS